MIGDTSETAQWQQQGRETEKERLFCYFTFG